MELVLLHKTVISESKVDIAALPAELQSKIQTLELKITEFANLPAEEQENAEAEKKKIETLSGKIGHAIKDIVEAPLPDDNGEMVPPPAEETEPPAVEPEQTETPPIDIKPNEEPIPAVQTEEVATEEETTSGRTFIQRNIDRRRQD